MNACRIIVFTPEDDFARMLMLYFESRDYIVRIEMLEEEWSADSVVEVCKSEMPNAIVMWDTWDSVSSPMLSVYRDLKDNTQTAHIAIALIMVRWPSGFTELPDYLFVHPFNIEHVATYIREGCLL